MRHKAPIGSVFCSVFILSTVTVSASSAQAPDYASMGFKALASWRCSVLAFESGEAADEGNRLFDLGYPLMAAVVRALRDAAVPEDQFEEFPVFISLNLARGPNIDFDLGVLWSEITKETNEQIKETMPEITADNFAIARDLRKFAVDEEFRRSSCRLID